MDDIRSTTGATPTKRAYARRANGELRALVVGVSVYRTQSGFANLPSADADSVAVTGALQETSALECKDVCELSTSAGVSPTRGEIIGRVKDLAFQAEESDRVLFYFSGHGVVIENKYYLVPEDAHAGNDPDVLVSFQDRILGPLESCVARQKILVIDACFSGAPASGYKTGQLESYSPRYLKRFIKSTTGVAVLASSQANQESLAQSNTELSLFTSVLIDGLNGNSEALRHGRLTVGSLFDFLTDIVPRRARQRQHEQRPQLFLNGSGDFVLGDFGEPAAPVPDGWQTVDFSVQRGIEAALAGDSLGYRDVEACPELVEVNQALVAIRASGLVAITGKSGCGKSMAAWHVAWRLYQEGWTIFAPTVETTVVPTVERCVLLVDNVQDGRSVVQPTAVSDTRWILYVSTERVPGVRDTIHIVGGSAVRQLAEALRQRADAILPILRNVNAFVGDGPMDTSPERIIDDAARGSESPWQFMFNLGDGRAAVQGAVRQLQPDRAPSLLLAAVAIRQLALKDGRGERPWIADQLTHAGIERMGDNFDDLLSGVAARIRLVVAKSGVALPHPGLARTVLGLALRGSWRDDIHALIVRQLQDPETSVLGLLWLVNSVNMTLFPRADEVGPLLERALTVSDPVEVGDAAALIAALLGRWPLPSGAHRRIADAISRWIPMAAPASAWGLSRLINNLYNVSKDIDSLVASIDPAAVGRLLAQIEADNAYGIGAFLHRIHLGASQEWSDSVLIGLDLDALGSSLQKVAESRLYAAAEVMMGVSAFDRSTGLALLRAISGEIAKALSASFADTFSECRDAVWYVLGLLPGFLRRREVDTEQAEAAASLVALLDVASIAKQLVIARRRDWKVIVEALEFIREASSEVASELASAIPFETLNARIEGYGHGLPHSEMDDIISGLCLNADREPGRSLAIALLTRRPVVLARTAAIAASGIPEFLRNGGSVSLPIGGALPRWELAAWTVFKVHEVDADAAAGILAQNRKGLSSGLLLQQHNSNEGLEKFLRVAYDVSQEELAAALAQIDHHAARANWMKRVEGSQEERASVSLIAGLLAGVEEAPDALRELASEVLSVASDSLSND